MYSATGLDFLSRHTRHGVEAFVFLGWLTPLLAIGGLVLLLARRELRLAAALGIGAVVPVLLALGTHFPLYSPLWHAFPPLRYPRVPERLMPIACLCLAALLAIAIDWGVRRPEAQRMPRLALGAIVAVVLLADLHVRAFHPSAADGVQRGLRGREARAEGSPRRGAGVHARHPLRQRLPLLRAARAARAAARLLDDGAAEAPTWSPATSSRSTAATGRRAWPTASGSSRPRRSHCTEASTSTTRSSRTRPGWPGGGWSPTGGGRRRPTAR